MALVCSSFRSLITIIHHTWFPSTCTLSLISRSIRSKPSLNPLLLRALNSQSHPTSQGNLLIWKQDERLCGPPEMGVCSTSTSTIAAIVTSLGGPPAAVGIVRLSGPSSVAIARKVFQPISDSRNKKKKKNNHRLRNEEEDSEKQQTCFWQPTSHFVEYGVVLDDFDNVIDELVARS